MTKLLYQYQREGNSPVFEAQEFINLIESHEPKLKGFFNMLFEAANPKGKNQEQKNCLNKRLCYFVIKW